MNADERLARWTAPLASPCVDARQHPAFEAIRSETAKLESPTGGTTDWAEVLRLGDGFLAEAGRDLIVASSLASALAHREGLDGIALGVRLLTTLLSTPGTAPTRPRARANALAAYVARAELALEGAKDRSRPSLEAVDVALRELDAGTASAIGDDAPSLRGLRDRVRMALDAIPAPLAALAQPIFAPPPPIPAALTAPSTESFPDRAEQVPSLVRRLAGQLVSAASLSRASSPLDADALRLTLVALYLPITSAPETTREARTTLAPPPKLVLESLAKSTAAPEALARDAIAALERSRFALDLHVHLSRALDRAGATAASSIHRHEVRGLLARLPELLEREFSDGTRFASADARAFFAAWEPAAESREAPKGDPLAEVLRLARAGRTVDALAAGSHVRSTACSGRERFDATLAMAQAAEDARALPLAAELHAALLAELDRHDLDAWDPALAATVLRASSRVASATPGSESLVRALFSRLARLDPRAAYEISSSLHATPAKPGR